MIFKEIDHSPPPSPPLPLSLLRRNGGIIGEYDFPAGLITLFLTTLIKAAWLLLARVERERTKNNSRQQLAGEDSESLTAAGPGTSEVRGGGSGETRTGLFYYV